MNTFKESVAYIVEKTKNLLIDVDEGQIQRVCEIFLGAERIFLYGAGRSGLVAKAFAIRLVHLGFQTYVIGETITPPVRENDLVVVISGSGETIPSVMTAEIAKKMGAKLIVITSRSDSKIVEYADISVVLPAECKEEKKKKLAPLGTLFEAAAWIFTDGLVAKLMEMKGESEEKMKERHATLQ